MLAARKQLEKTMKKDFITSTKNTKNAKKATGSPGKEGAKYSEKLAGNQAEE